MVVMKSDYTNLFSAIDTYCSEEYFQRMLVFERKRSKQSGRPFMLILLDIDKLLKGRRKEIKFVLKKLISALDSSMPEIDIKGWYMRDSIIGVICQDVNSENIDFVNGKFGDKLIKGYRFSLNVKKADSIKMRRRFYPDSKEKSHSGTKTERIFYGSLN
jgi:hypothetical protein